MDTFNITTQLDPLGLEQSIYDELKKVKHYSSDLDKCVQDTVDALLNQEQDNTGMYKPVCLLGKIQSGKTKAFIGVIAKMFDIGINTIVVLTKNSTILGKQTTKRIANDLNGLTAGRDIAVDYITEIDENIVLGAAQSAQKRIIVGIKHHENIKKIYDYLITLNPALAKNQILIIDDEADISAVGYRSIVENVPFESLSKEEQEEIINSLEGTDIPGSVRTERKEMLLVAEGINQLRINLPGHMYLQVTATPASIFLQPENIRIQTYNDDYSIEKVAKAPLLSDKTILLPIHEKYIGGEFFFGEAEDETSMASFVHRAVGAEELRRMQKRDQRHINNIFKSNNFPRLTEFVDNLLLTAACNVAIILDSNTTYPQVFEKDPLRILTAIKNHLGGFASMVHTSTLRGIHGYQADLLVSYINHCANVWLHNPENLRKRLKNKLKDYYDSSIMASFAAYKNRQGFKNSPMSKLAQIPFDLILKCYGAILKHEHIQVFIINSDKKMEDRIDKQSGELKRDVLANIYVGGQSLDRGITLERMVGFFYGREPQVAQLDTTLQHARVYGARKPEDLVFTRLFLSDNVRRRLSEITEIDGVLRQSIINNDGDNRFAAIELGARGQVRPTSPNRIMISDCINLRSYKRFLPVGFQTRKGDACETRMKEIDQIIKINLDSKIEGFENDEKCFIQWPDLENIFQSFMNGVIDSAKWDEDPNTRNWNLDHLKAFYGIIKKSYFPEDDRIILNVKRNRALNRIKIDGRLQDAPDTAKTDLDEMKQIMQTINVPGLFLFEQKGDEKIEGDINYGWNNQRFYWPLILLPQLNRNIMVSLDAIRKGKALES